MESISEVANLETLIKYNAKVYYEGHPTISDDHFDYLIEKLRGLDPENKLLTTTGWGYVPEDSNPSLKTVKHTYDLAKFEGKIYDPDLIKIPFTKRVATPKYDGGSIILYYVDGILTNAVTRGDGKQGFDVTANFGRIVPTVLNDKSFSGMVRGEGIMKTNVFESKYHPKGYESARNLSIGWARKAGVSEEEIKDLSFVAYTVRGRCKEPLDTKFKVLDWLKDNNFETAERLRISDWSKEALVKIVKKYRHIYGIDGIVVTSIDYDEQADGTYVPKKEVAYKIRAATREVTVGKITWDVTRTCKVVPVVWFNKVKLAGANITKATGFNAEFISRNKIAPGARIVIQRSGEVIPNIIDVKKPVEPVLPTTCPICNHKLERIGTDLWCINNTCPAHISNTLHHFIKTMAPVKGLGDTLIDQFIKYFVINDIKDIYSIDESQLELLTTNNGVGSQSVNLLKQMLKKLKLFPLEFKTLLVSLNIKGLSTKAAEKLQDLYKVPHIDQEDYIVNSGVNKTVKNSLFTNNGLKLINEVLEFVEVTSSDKSSIEVPTKLKVAITGKLSLSRKKLVKLLENAGVKEVSINKADFLLTNTPDSTSNKNKVANKLGLDKVTEESLQRYLSSKGVVFNGIQ